MSTRLPKRFATAAAILLAALLSPASLASVPGQISYQGLLLDSVGDPVNGSVDLDFSLFDALTGGSQLWTESHTGVSVLDGVYDVLLGETTPLTASVVSGGTLYLEIVVDTETLTPRQRLVAVPYALEAESANSVGGVGATFVSEIFEHFAFDGADPPNDDPSEGFGDPDGDGIANFIDPDNDNDGISDATEVSNGSDINLVTPSITGFSPEPAEASITTQVAVLGSFFEPGQTVVFGSETPTPFNLTSTSFDVLVGPQPAGTASVTVTLGNGEQSSDQFDFILNTPTITGFSPEPAEASITTQVAVLGSNFVPGLTVVFGSEAPAPFNITPTSFDLSVGPQPAGTVAVTVTLPNGEMDSANFDFVEHTPSIASFDPPSAGSSQTTVVTVFGSDFLPGLQVVFGSENPAPTNLTSTSFDVSVGPQPLGLVNVVVSYPSGQQDSDSYAFVTVVGTRLVFVTAASSAGNLGGLSGADATCQAAADGASLPGSYLAWLSDGVDDPASRANQLGGPFMLVDLVTPVANDWADLTDGTLANAIDQDQNGTLVSADFPWTNVDSDGTAVSTDPVNGHCGAWTSSSGAPTPAGGIGRTTVTDSTWTNLTTTACDTSRPLFCFQE